MIAKNLLIPKIVARHILGGLDEIIVRADPYEIAQVNASSTKIEPRFKPGVTILVSVRQLMTAISEPHST